MISLSFNFRILSLIPFGNSGWAAVRCWAACTNTTEANLYLVSNVILIYISKEIQQALVSEGEIKYDMELYLKAFHSDILFPKHME